jgi:hypothetical protein
MNSVTFDENSTPAGVVEVARGHFHLGGEPSPVKAMFGAAARAAGARLPADSAIAEIRQSVVGESFMRRNADRYHHVFFAARLVVVLLSVLLGLLVWFFARRLYGARGAVLALALYAFAPDAIAHGGLATLEISTALGFLASVYACWRFARTSIRAGSARPGRLLTFLTRFSAFALVLCSPAPAVLVKRRPEPGGAGPRARAHDPLALAAGYAGQISFRPLQHYQFVAVIRRPAAGGSALGFPSPTPDHGLDWQTYNGQRGQNPAYLFGRVRAEPVWYYFPIAILCKWPLGFLAALLARAGLMVVSIRGRARRAREMLVLGPPVLFLLGAMFFLSLDVGVRYVFPLLPFLCVWCGGLIARAHRGAPRWAKPRVMARGAVALAVLVAIESVSAAPWQLSFFNRLAGGPGGGYRILNDSNVDWGQGLIALRAEMKRLHLGRIHLTYHGTTDPAMYGIDYVPYFGGKPGPESDWLAVSSYYFVGLTQRMMTTRGRTGPVTINFMLGRRPVADRGPHLPVPSRLAFRDRSHGRFARGGPTFERGAPPRRHGRR